MESQRPGHAAVQYGDLRGEAAADIADALGSLQTVARELGLNAEGLVVGIAMYGSPTYGDDLSITFQVVDSVNFDELRAKLVSDNGVLEVTEHQLKTPALRFLACFKRLNVSLFTRAVKPVELRIK